MSVIREEIVDIKTRYGDERKTEIADSVDDIDYEDLITKSLKISNRFVFSYKHNCLFIKILKNSGEDNPILLFNKLFKEI